jgi:hypothetical protein
MTRVFVCTLSDDGTRATRDPVSEIGSHSWIFAGNRRAEGAPLPPPPLARGCRGSSLVPFPERRAERKENPQKNLRRK